MTTNMFQNLLTISLKKEILLNDSQNKRSGCQIIKLAWLKYNNMKKIQLNMKFYLSSLLSSNFFISLTSIFSQNLQLSVSYRIKELVIWVFYFQHHTFYLHFRILKMHILRMIFFSFYMFSYLVEKNLNQKFFQKICVSAYLFIDIL